MVTVKCLIVCPSVQKNCTFVQKSKWEIGVTRHGDFMFCQLILFLSLTCRWCGYSRAGNLWHYAVHSQPDLDMVCRPGCKHGQLTAGCRHCGYEALSAQRPHYGAPAFWGGQGKKNNRICNVFLLFIFGIMLNIFDWWFQGQATDIAIQAEEILKLKRQINNLYCKHTGQPLETIGTVFGSSLLLRSWISPCS